MKLAHRVARIQESPTIKMAAKVRALKNEGIDIIGLNAGEADTDTPLQIKAAGIEAIHDGQTRYTAVEGTNTLRQAIKQKLLTQNQLEYETSQIIAGNGAKQILSHALMALVEHNDEVIIPAPYWTSYLDMVRLTGAKPVIINTTIQNSFKFSAEQLERNISPQTRVLILNSPHNPSGCIYTKSELEAFAEVLKKHPQIIVITDDIYEHLIWHEEQFVNFANVSPEMKERTLVVNGVSKAYAMTGWRLGFGAGPVELIQAMKKIQSQTTSCPSSISQIAATEALNGGSSLIDDFRATLKKNHDYLYTEISKLDGFNTLPADGGFFIFPNVSGLIQRLGLNDDMELCNHLIEEAKVAVVPGQAFGMRNHIRLSFARSMPKLESAIDRLKVMLDSA